MKKPIYYFDLDGTLLNDNHELSKRTINFFKENRNLFITGIATGRPAYMIKREIEILNPNLPIITMNGACIVDNKGNFEEPLFIKYIEKNDQKLILKYLKKHEMNFLVYTENKMLYSDKKNTSKRKMYIEDKISSCKARHKWIFEDIKNHDIDDLNISKFLIMIDENDKDKIKNLIKLIKNLDKTFFVKSSNNLIDIIPKEASKGIAINTVSKIKSINLKEISVFGDAPNDIAMFSICGYGIAMKNAISSLKLISSEITKFTNEEDGVIRWIEKKLNIK